MSLCTVEATTLGQLAIYYLNFSDLKKETNLVGVIFILEKKINGKGFVYY